MDVQRAFSFTPNAYQIQKLALLTTFQYFRSWMRILGSDWHHDGIRRVAILSQGMRLKTTPKLSKLIWSFMMWND